MLTGYKKACEDKMDVIAIMAGDGQMDPAILDKIIEPILQDRADYTKGDRLTIQDNRQGMPAFRLLGNRLTINTPPIRMGGEESTTVLVWERVR